MNLIFGKKIVVLAVLAGFLAVSRFQIERLYPLPFPHFDQLITNHAGFQDAGFLVAGFRALAADIAWIQLLQNMGDYGSEKETATKSLPYLKDDTLRVTRIDPYFVGAYLFGAATLAWLRSTNRPDEALELLEEGIRYNPKVWNFRFYVAGIGFSKTNQTKKMIQMLEKAIKDPDCPTTVKSVLANTYKREGRYLDALAIWEDILSSEKGRDYHGRAKEEIQTLMVNAVQSRKPSAATSNPPAPR